MTLKVAGVVGKILKSNNLGTLKAPKASRVFEPTTDDVFWGGSGGTDDLPSEGAGKEWELLVVDDSKVVNAAAAFSMCDQHLTASEFVTYNIIVCQRISSCSRESFLWQEMRTDLLRYWRMVRGYSTYLDYRLNNFYHRDWTRWCVRRLRALSEF